MKAKIYIQLALGMALFGSGLPVSKIVGQAFPIFLAADLRMLVSFLVLLPFTVKEWKTVRQLEKKDWLLLFWISAIGVFGFSVAMLYGMRLASGVTGSIVMATTPVVTAIGSVIFFKEKLNQQKIWAIILAVLGIVVIELGTPQDQHSQPLMKVVLGVLLIFLAVCCESGYTLLGKLATKNLDSLKIATLCSLIALVLFLPFAIVQGLQFDYTHISLKAWLSLVWFGAGSMALGTLIWYQGVKKAEASIAAGFMGMMPLSGLILSYGLLGEPFQWMHLVGMGIELGALFLIVRAQNRQKPDIRPDNV